MTDLHKRLLAPSGAEGHATVEGQAGEAGAAAPAARTRDFATLTRAFLSQIRPYVRAMAFSLGVLAIATVLGLLPVYGTKLIIDSILGNQPLTLPGVGKIQAENLSKEKLLTIVVLAMAGVSIVSIAIGIWSRWQVNKISHMVTVRLQKKVFEHVMRLPFHRVGELKTGGASSMLREDAGGVGQLVFGMLYNPWQAVIQLTGILAILAWTDWRMFLASLAVAPAVYFTHKTWIARIRPLFSDIRSTRQGIDAHTTEAIGGFRVVRSFSRQNHEVVRYAMKSHFMMRQEFLSWWWARAIDICWLLFMPLATAALFWFGGLRVLQDAQEVASGALPAQKALSVGDLVMFLAYLGWLLGPMNTLVQSATEIQNSLAGLDRILNLLSEKKEETPKPGARKIDPQLPPGAFKLIAVGYGYPASKGRPGQAMQEQETKPQVPNRILHDISLDIQPGEMVAFVGRSGSGKTTLCNLLARCFEPTEGAIHYDGTDTREIDLASYRSIFGVVEQETFLFDGTIAENIAYGRPQASEEEVRQAAKKADAHGFIEKLPLGYKTKVGERGLKLSGGQRQRISLARAILTDPKVLILDEATSALDSHTEKQIQRSLRELMKGRTSLVIAHRLSTILHADKIAMMEQGRIVGFNNHARLLEECQSYREMFELQMRTPEMVEQEV